MGLLSFVGNIVSDVLGGTTAREQQQDYNLQNMAIQQKYAQENMAIQNQYNIDAFTRENEYNAPINQRARAQAAGLNPNFDNTAGTIAQQDSGTSATMPSGGMPTAGAQGSIGDLLSLFKVGKELKNIKADTDEKLANADKLKADAEHQEIQNESDKEFLHDERYQGIRKFISETDLNQAMRDKSQAEKEQVFSTAHAYQSYLLSQADFNDKQQKALMDSLPKLLLLYDAQAANQRGQAYYYNQQGTYVPQYAAAATTQANASLISAKTGQILAHNDTIRTSLDRISTLADAAYKESQTSGQKLLNGLNGLTFKVESQLYKEDIPQKERRELLKNVRTARSKMDAEIREIDSRKDLNEENKRYLRSSSIKNYVETLNDLFEPFDYLKPPGLSGIQKLK